MTVVITPVGTSLFKNGSQRNPNIGTFFNNIKKKRENSWAQNGAFISPLRQYSTMFVNNKGTSASAELQSIEIIRRELQKGGNQEKRIEAHLLASDTIASRLAAEILREYINSSNHFLANNVTAKFNADPTQGEIDIIRHLQVEDSTEFSREGMPNLFHRINDIKDWIAFGSQNLAINITGGYGATLPYLTIFGQLENVPLYYNFEDTTELIEIPQAPLAIDWQLIKDNVDVLEEIDKGIEASKWHNFKNKNYQAVEALKAFIWEDGSTGACLSSIGVIYWDQYLKSHFTVKLANNITMNNHIRKVIQDLYRRLKERLNKPDHLKPACCYGKIRGLSEQDDLNHTGPVNKNINIFIFKSTVNNQQTRLMYTFAVNGRAITQVKIYDQKGHLDSKEYQKWKADIERNHSIISFSKHIFDVPK